MSKHRFGAVISGVLLLACHHAPQPIERAPASPTPKISAAPDTNLPQAPAAQVAPPSTLNDLPQPAPDAAHDAESLPPVLGETSANAMDATNIFTRRVYGTVASQQGANLFLSPASVSLALAMTYAGARGQTAEEIAAALAFTARNQRFHTGFQNLLWTLTRPANSGPELRIANRIWSRLGLLLEPQFARTTSVQYAAPTELLDFGNQPESAGERINAWVRKQTRDKIPELLTPGIIHTDTKLVLTNAIYFKGAWRTRFNPKNTKPGPFYVKPGNSVQTPLMSAEVTAGYGHTNDAQVLELDYRSGLRARQASMLIVLPQREVSLEQIERQIVNNGIKPYLNVLEKMKVDVTLPRYRMSFQRNLVPTLQTLGMKLAFTPQADFSGVTKTEALLIDTVEHAAFVDVNEEGTEAAAATAVVTSNLGYSFSPTFRADRPFIFLIREKQTGLILFIGRFAAPN